MHYYKFNISDWHLATSHLTLEEETVYFRLINFYYDTEKPIPLETQSVIRRLRLGTYTAMVEGVLHEFFVKQKDGWHHVRCDDEIEKYHHKAETNQKVGKLGGRPRKINNLDENPKKTEMVSENNPQVTLTTNHKPITNNHIKTITPDGVSESIFKDYKKLREKKKAPITETVLKGLEREAKKANMSLQSVMELCCERGWSGFKADWIIKEEEKSKELPLGNEQQIEAAYRAECGDPAKSRFNSYWEMKNFVIAQREKRKLVV
jgi:uncharacterized protein YdaU (DUF1376 family)